MKLTEFKELLQANRNKQFLIMLPNRKHIPVSFHVTEVGQVDKTFIDCGGKVHSLRTCQLQVWVGDDVDHRLEAGKLVRILELARAIVPNDDIDLEFEYEDSTISQYPVADYTITNEAIVFQLEPKHTDCLAKEICLIPVSGSCCGPTGCC